jgi:hypothetical protein
MIFIYSLCPMLRKNQITMKKSLIRHAMSIEHRITSGKTKNNEKNQKQPLADKKKERNICISPDAETKGKLKLKPGRTATKELH